MLKIYKSRWILPANGQVIENGAVVIENGRIIDITSKQNLPDNADIVDYKNAVIIPGFINLHTHLQFTNLKKNKLPFDQKFVCWIKDLIRQYYFWSISKKKASVEEGLKESILSGTTCICQLSGETEFLDIFNDSDIRTYLFLETFSKDEKTSKVEFEKLKEKIGFIRQNKDDNLEVGISPHSVYNVHPVLWRKIAQFALENDLMVHAHLAESKAEMGWLQYGHSDIDSIHKLILWGKINPYKTGLNPVEYLENIGVLNENLILAHLCQLEENEFDTLTRYKVKIAHCPRSNMYLHDKTIELNKIADSHFPLNSIGVGTDSKFSNYDLNLINEIRFIKNKTGLDLLKLIDMLTINAAKILRLDNKTGSLEKGKEADFLVFNLNDNESWQDFINKDRPDHVFVKGKQLVKDGDFRL